jgi:hypothetical protein
VHNKAIEHWKAALDGALETDPGRRTAANALSGRTYKAVVMAAKKHLGIED